VGLIGVVIPPGNNDSDDSIKFSGSPETQRPQKQIINKIKSAAKNPNTSLILKYGWNLSWQPRLLLVIIIIHHLALLNQGFL
jgi:hypothetical protein